MPAVPHLATLDALIQDLVNYHPDPALHPDELLRASPPEYPVHFYDRHVDPRLTLAQVKVVPLLAQTLSEFCDRELEKFKTQVEAIAERETTQEHPTELSSARGFAELYHQKFAQYCLPFPSALYLHPHSPEWEALTAYTLQRPSRNRLSTFVAEARVSMDVLYRRMYDPEAAADGLYLPDEAGVRKLHEMRVHSPSLALWHLYPLNMSGEKVITQMAGNSSFKWEMSNTVAPHLSITHSFQDDPDSSNWIVTRTHEAASTGRPKRHLGRCKLLRKPSRAAVPSVARRDFNSEKPYRADWRHFIQHVWTQAVAEDVTFIVLTCGKLERIGVRHRASRTLYLSDVITPTTAKSPTYGKIHFGLHFAILQDALARNDVRKHRILTSEDQVEQVDGLASIRKRSREASDDEDNHPAKRRKEHSSQDFARDMDSIFRALSERDLLFLGLNYGTFQSPVPSSFLRKAPSCAPGFHRSMDGYTSPKRRKSYQHHEYITLSLGKPIGDGATGTVHRAWAEIFMESGEVLHHPLAVKLVFLDRVTRRHDEVIYAEGRLEEKRVWDEYHIYQHLASAGCRSGILSVFGLFEDIETGALALVMEDGGTSLESLRWQVEPDDYIKFALQEAEQQQLLDYMQKVHEAGVRHRDIWSTNILKGENNKFFIIDFDKAEIVPYPSESMDREKLRLERLVKGIDSGEDSRLYSF